MLIRLDKYLADMQVGTRSEVKELIRKKRVTVNDNKVLSYNSDKDYSEIHVTIHEGKFHQVKRMFTAIGSEVLFLKRITFGALSLDESLKTGEYRTLTKEEISILQRNQIKR